MAKPIIAVLTDFGSRDHYAGVMKGVVLGINPDVTIVDLSHDLPAHDIPFAAHELAATYKYFPSRHDLPGRRRPGVGSARRGLAAEVGEWRFVAPDNGVLTGVFQETSPKKVVELTERRYARPTVSRTFEGRDRFAPAAAWLSKGVHLTAFGRPVTDYHLLDLPKPVLDGATLRGAVVRIDRFGNVVTNLDRRSCERLADGGGGCATDGAEPLDCADRLDLLGHSGGRSGGVVWQHRPPRGRGAGDQRRGTARRRRR